MVIRKLFNYWISKDRSGFYTFIAVVCAVIYGIGAMMKEYIGPQTSGRLKLIGFLGFLLLAVVYLIHRNLNAYYDFLELFKDTDHLPQKQISYVNSFCMTIFLIAALAGILMLTAAADPLWDAIAEWFANRPVIENTQEPPQETAVPIADQQPSMNMNALLGLEPQKPSALMEFLDKAAGVLGVILAVALLLFLLGQISNRIWSFIVKPRHFDEDEKIYLKPTLEMALDFRRADDEDKRKGGLRAFLSYTARIRRYYKKQILTKRKQLKAGSPPGSASPEEIEFASGLENETLHRLYEKARYGPEECTEEDWKALS